MCHELLHGLPTFPELCYDYTRTPIPGYVKPRPRLGEHTPTGLLLYNARRAPSPPHELPLLLLLGELVVFVLVHDGRVGVQYGLQAVRRKRHVRVRVWWGGATGEENSRQKLPGSVVQHRKKANQRAS